MSPAHSRVRCVRLIIYRMLARPPRKSTFVYNNPTKACTVSTYPFGQRRNDNVTSVLERFAKVGLERDNNSIVLISRKSTKMHNSIHYSHQSTYRRKCGVYNDWQAMRVCRLTNSVQITNLKNARVFSSMDRSKLAGSSASTKRTVIPNLGSRSLNMVNVPP